MYGFASTKKLFSLYPDYFETYFQKQLVKREIFLQDILSHSSGVSVAKEAEKNAHPYYSYRVIDEKHDDILSNILVWDDKVAVMVLDDPLFGTITKDQRLADTYRLQLKLIWNSLKK